MQIKILVILLSLIGMSCQNPAEEKRKNNSVEDVLLVDEATTKIDFDKEKWKIKKGWGYAYRNEMLDDLMNDPDVRALKKGAILDLLGLPERIEGDYLYYLIDQKRAIILPLHTKTLVIHLNRDSTINWMKTHE